MNLFFALFFAATAIPDGSLFYIENGNKTVQRYTDSKITHVAIIVNINNEPWVYEADKPEVRKIRLLDYYSEIEKYNKKKKEKNKWKVWISHPKKIISEKQKNKLKEYLDSQIGRKYSVDSYLYDEPGKGIHCCEMVGNALKLIGCNCTDSSHTDSPIEVWTKTQKFYEKPILVELD